MWRENLTRQRNDEKGFLVSTQENNPKQKEKCMWEPRYCIEIETWTLGTSGNNNTTMMILALTWFGKKRPNGIMIEVSIFFFFQFFNGKWSATSQKKDLALKWWLIFF